MQTRRKFLGVSIVGSAAALAPKNTLAVINEIKLPVKGSPVVLSTWDFGKTANVGAWNVLAKGGRALDIIKKDIEICKELGCNGISVGTQTINAEIDTEWLKRIVDWAGPMGVTCNRAFDGTPDPYKALEDLISCGCERVLTSGQEGAAPDAGETLGKLVKQAAGRIIIMPGAGVKSSNLKKLIADSNATQFHASARAQADNPLRYINTRVSDYGSVYISVEEEIRAMVAILNG
jgi:copper homeostasis protein